MDIRYVKYEDLEIPKYNGCVHYAYNSNIFGMEWYLKATVRSFDALVEGDYTSVMPLTINSEKSSKIELNPLVGRLGIYSVNVLSPSRNKAFLDALREQFQSVDMLLNEAMLISELKNFTVENYEVGHINLNQEDVGKFNTTPYDHLNSNYNSEITDNLSTDFYQRGIKPVQLNIEDFVDYYVSMLKQSSISLPLKRIMYNAHHRGVGFQMAYQNDENEVVGLAYFIYDQNKVYNIVLASKNADEDLQIFMLDSFIRANAGRPLILDLNYIRPDLAKGMGAEMIPYQRISKKTKLELFLNKLGL